MISNCAGPSRSSLCARRGVPRRQHEAVAARGERADRVAEDRAQAREALEGAQLEELVEQEGRRSVAGRACGVQECERGVERLAGARRRPRDVCMVRWKRRGLANRLVEPLGCRRYRLDVDVLRRRATEEIPQAQQERGASGAAAAKHHGNPRSSAGRAIQCGQDPALEGRPLRDHHRAGPPLSSEGMSMPRRRAVSIASGYPASACRTTPSPGSQVSTRCSFSSASRVPSATITMPACSE